MTAPWRGGSRRVVFGAAAAIATSVASLVSAQASQSPPRPFDLVVTDRPLDGGDGLVVRWNSSGSDPKSWSIFRSRTKSELERFRRDRRVAAAQAAWASAMQGAAPADPEARVAAEAAARAAAESVASHESDVWFLVAEVPGTTATAIADKLPPGSAFRVRVAAIGENDAEGAFAETSEAITPDREMVLGDRVWLGLILLVLCATIGTCIFAAMRGRVMKIRRIAGLEAIDEAVGRATEMGRSVLYIPGIQDMDNVQTVAGVTILSHVARTAAEYEARIEVPTARSLVMTACREAMESAYYSAGRPEDFNPDQVNYITDEQFGYVAYVAGRMVREKPATCIYMGQFYAESLLLSENGNAIGAIQIAGTAETSQLPFFVAACDYTLIGEEFFAASAYLSGEPPQIGSLLGQDIGKALMALVLIGGVTSATIAALVPDSFASTITNYLRETVLKG